MTEIDAAFEESSVLNKNLSELRLQHSRYAQVLHAIKSFFKHHNSW